MPRKPRKVEHDDDERWEYRIDEKAPPGDFIPVLARLLRDVYHKRVAAEASQPKPDPKS